MAILAFVLTDLTFPTYDTFEFIFVGIVWVVSGLMCENRVLTLCMPNQYFRAIISVIFSFAITYSIYRVLDFAYRVIIELI